MKKAAIAVLFLAGAVVAAGENGKMGGFGNFISDVQAEDELAENDKEQKEIIEETDTTEEDRVAAIDTSITLGAGSRIAVVRRLQMENTGNLSVREWKMQLRILIKPMSFHPMMKFL